MKSPALAYAVIFLIISTISTVLGIITLTSREKNRKTWSFFAISVCLSVWSLGFALSISAPTEETCLLWRRFSALGWGAIFAVIVEFALHLNGIEKLEDYKWVAVLHYLPAMLTVYVFAISNRMAAVQYRFVRLSSGWANVAVNNGWDIFFYIYMGVYALFSAALLFRQWRLGPDENRKSEARLLLIAFGSALVVGTLTDLVNSSLHLLNIPQIAPVMFVLPLMAIYYSMNRYSFLSVSTGGEGIILTNEVRNKLMTFLAYGFIAGGLIYFPTQYFISGASLMIAVFASAVFIGFGCLMLAVRKGAIKRQGVEVTFIVSAIITIPAVTMHFIEYAGITVWAFPFIFVVLSMMFNTKNLLITSSVSILFTQLLVWVSYPYSTVPIDSSDFITRIGIFAIAIWIAFYINNVYIARLRENVEQNRYQRLISHISSMLVSNGVLNTEQKVQDILAEGGRCFGADTAFLYLFDPVSREQTGRYVWTARDDLASPLPSGDCNDLFCHLIREETALDDTVAKAEDHPMISARAFLSLPLRLTETSAGFLGLSVSDAPKNWRTDQVDTLRIISNTVSDWFAKQLAENRISFMAYHDFLTKLPNRLLFGDRVEKAIQLASRTKKQVGVVFLDLDAFKSVNDTLGHRVGDELIKEVAKKLTGSVSASDMVSRFGGDEFLIMFNDMSKRSDFVRAADALMALFDTPFHLQGQEIFVTASAGIAVYPFDGEDTDTLIKNADIAMYNAKEGGKNQYLFCSEEMKEDTKHKAQLTNSLYRVLERGELRVYYQPQVDLQTQEIIGAEALLRWFHPELGLISPGVFIPLAEKTGLINTIGHWVLNEACRQLRQWQDRGLPIIRVAVNISANQLRNPAFAQQVDSILHEHGLPAQYLELEVTETVAIKEPTYVVTMLDKLKALGVFLSIDDFGTEYSSLSRLKQLPVDRIKIDMQFIQGIDKNDKDKAISKVIINLAKSLGMKVIAEGVETKEQLTFLNQRLCDEVQGFFFYKPMPAEEFERILVRMGTESLAAVRAQA